MAADLMEETANAKLLHFIAVESTGSFGTFVHSNRRLCILLKPDRGLSKPEPSSSNSR